MKSLAHWLIRRAARSAPHDLSERLEEEWLADLEARPAPWSALRFAIGCCWATKVIAFEHAGAAATLAGPAVGPKGAFSYLHESSGPFSRRSGSLMLVVGLHVAVFYGLLVGLNVDLKKWVEPPLQTVRMPEVRKDLPPPQIPPPTLERPQITAVIPEIPPDISPDGGEVIARPPPVGPTLVELQPPPHVVSRVSGGPGSGFPATDDFYPSAAKRLEEQGIATVHVCVDAHGRLTSDPTTVQGSGSAKLDAGALQLAKAGSGHYRPSTEDGRPVDGCYSFRVRFQLRS